MTLSCISHLYVRSRLAANRRRPRPRTQCTSATNAASQLRAKSTTRNATFTHYGCNAWTFEFEDSGVKFLVDPWLVDTLAFADQKWLLEGSKAHPASLNDVLEGVQFIILSQYLDDHAHKPTLKVLPKDLTVIAQPEAAKLAQDMGYQNVITIDHGDEVKMANGKVLVKATPGALVGPPWSKRQNALVIKENTANSQLAVFYEPHASHDQTALAAIGKVDIAIIPTRSAYALGYPVVEGQENAANILSTLQPDIVVPFRNNENSYSGIASALISAAGSDDVTSVSEQLQRLSLGSISVVGADEIGKPVQLSL